jgi:hypothetical protein
MSTRMNLAGVALAIALSGTARAAEPSTLTSAPSQAAVIYTKDKPPAMPKLADLSLKESVSQYGITWTFEDPARVGQFVSGDWYVIGPVTVKAVDPRTLRGDEVPRAEIGDREKRYRKGDNKLVRNGSMLDPPAKMVAAFDSGIREFFRPELVAEFPVRLSPGDALVSSISIKMGESAARIEPGSAFVQREADDTAIVRTVAVLTCLKEAVPADAFRPSFCDREHKTIYLARNLRRELLPSAARVAETPKIEEYVRKTHRVWFDVTWFNFSAPVENVPRYGQLNGRMMSNAGLLLCCDFTPQEKEPLLENLVQIGIDYWGVAQAGHPGWGAFGGHCSGRKFPIVFAGLLLGDDAMARVNKSLPKVGFGEDEQTAYGDCWTGAKVVWTGHSGIVSATGKPHADDEEGRRGFGPYEHLQPSKWTKENLVSEGYRTANTSSAWIGQALAMRLMHAEEIWSHDAFFDYCDRWMIEDDTPFRHEIAKYFPGHAPDEAKWCQQRGTWDRWVDGMYAKYRPTLKAPMDGWKTQHDDSYYRSAIQKSPEQAASRPKE